MTTIVFDESHKCEGCDQFLKAFDLIELGAHRGEARLTISCIHCNTKQYIWEGGLE